MKRKIFYIFLILILSSSFQAFSLAENNEENLILKIENDKKEVYLDETFKIYIDIGNISVSAYTLNLYFDNSKLEYAEGPENTNILNNRIITIWYDEKGGINPKENEQIAEFTFRAIEEGNINFNLSGEFFDKDGNVLNVNEANIQLKIKGIEESKDDNQEEKEDLTTSNDSSLKILRLSEEGIVPEFLPDIKDYYFVTNKDFTNLNITAIPNNSDANVRINGNDNLNEGINKITIDVISKDKTSKSTYTINLTKTKNVEDANANLETLAIENVLLEPIFDTNTLNYKASVSNNIENLNIFAVPENTNGKVEIEGGSNLKEGTNIVNIKVTAPNGFSFRNYQVIIHRRTLEEDEKYQEEQEASAKKLSTILEEQENIENIKEENNKEEAEENKKNDVIKKVIIVIGLMIIVTTEIIVIKKRKAKRNV